MSTERRIAKIPLHLGDIARMLQLPEGVKPTFTYVTNDPPVIWVIVASDEFPPVPDGVEAPIVATRSEVIEIDGHHYLRPVPAATARELADRVYGSSLAVANHVDRGRP